MLFSTLFLDRDGVINVRMPGDYVKHSGEFIFEKGALEAIALLSEIFPRIVVVTNQAGISKKLMQAEDVLAVHKLMTEQVRAAGGRIDRAYFCPHGSKEGCPCRKPNVGMALQAQKDFPEINFSDAWMVGDSASDMLFGQRLGMKTALIEGKFEDLEALKGIKTDAVFASLFDFAQSFKR